MAGCEYSLKRNERDENAATKRKDEKHVLLLTLATPSWNNDYVDYN